MFKVQLATHEEKKRLVEFILIIVISVVLVALSRLEGNLFELSKQLSEHQDFLTSVVYFSLININVVLVLVLSFLIFRNVAKLVLERRRGVIGSRLRSKLVVALVFFALAPTALLFYISTRFLTESFDTWFSAKVEATMHKTREAGALVYERDKRRIEGLARIALQRIDVASSYPFENSWSQIDTQRLKGFAQEYRVFGVRVFDRDGQVIWSSALSYNDEPISIQTRQFVLGAIERFRAYPGMTSRAVVDVDQGRDVVRGVAPIVDPSSQAIVGVVLTEERFDTQILKSVEGIIQEFANLKPGAELIRLSYLILLVLMVLIILFSATWLGFYVSKGIMAPIQSLAEATKEVALGNYEVNLVAKTDDETGQLIRSFNSMTADLKAHEQQVRDFTAKLEKTNVELDQRRKYMEVILRNISAGVISVSSSGIVTSINRAAEKLLGISAEGAINHHESLVFTGYLMESFWKPIQERVSESAEFTGQIELDVGDRSLTLLADGIKISDEAGEDLGMIVVFDDASEQVKAQRVAAWREVARRIAHEIKNPITPIKLSAQRLLRKFGNQFEGKDQQVFSSCVETIVSEVDGLRDLVNEFSKFARMPAVRTQPENLYNLIRDVVGMYSLSYSHVTFDIGQLPKDLPLVQLDREQMIRVFTNLIANSIDALAEVGLISISASMLPGYEVVRVSIADTGCGIPDRVKQKVMEPYFSTKKHGTGLGLAIVNQIVSDHGGYLRIQDNVPEGTIVVMELPVG
ncbi:sensor histidine kinase [Pseudobacteriovorax antillogorgiicola]|uniref:histidine kinase n=1 Tax=Pseudobacteriovorax antillogorgiicola TaxID=1513793 RepID=A0A1Y6B6L8_9BACT|nr:ATP-binding protein [Pseudobacteriovorax antillogorgiicola]TCS59480.1 PAS/PAC sensor signal transduction histidine kinase [Pseudobacteriovorax antillogorgiicola]SME88005.1 two-component system, NtrC family, nitrogen regulation sensor histidine kinase NtrY [Pseudobacteriovorax antillogorgiicola]